MTAAAWSASNSKSFLRRKEKKREEKRRAPSFRSKSDALDSSKLPLDSLFINVISNPAPEKRRKRKESEGKKSEGRDTKHRERERERERRRRSTTHYSIKNTKPSRFAYFVYLSLDSFYAHSLDMSMLLNKLGPAVLRRGQLTQQQPLNNASRLVNQVTKRNMATGE